MIVAAHSKRICTRAGTTTTTTTAAAAVAVGGGVRYNLIKTSHSAARVIISAVYNNNFSAAKDWFLKKKTRKGPAARGPNRKLNTTLMYRCVAYTHKQRPGGGGSDAVVYSAKIIKVFKGHAGRESRTMLFETHNAHLCSCLAAAARKEKKKGERGGGFGHLLFFRRNPCRGHNLLNNNVTFIQWYMTFKKKNKRRRGGGGVSPVFSGPDSKHGIRIKYNPFGFCFRYGLLL